MKKVIIMKNFSKEGKIKNEIRFVFAMYAFLIAFMVIALYHVGINIAFELSFIVAPLAIIFLAIITEVFTSHAIEKIKRRS